MIDNVRRILVLCTANRCRSQMAEGWLRCFAGSRLSVCSAGTAPKPLHPLAIRVMAEAGVDIADQASHHVDHYADQPFQVVVTVCDGVVEACPIFARAGRLVHQPFDDPDRSGLPDAELIDLFRRVRDEICDWARGFVVAECDDASTTATPCDAG